jgi:hypothetical protein
LAARHVVGAPVKRHTPSAQHSLESQDVTHWPEKVQHPQSALPPGAQVPSAARHVLGASRGMHALPEQHSVLEQLLQPAGATCARTSIAPKTVAAKSTL